MLKIFAGLAATVALGVTLVAMPLDTRSAVAQQASAPNPAALVAAKELLTALGSDKQLETVMPMLMQQMRQVVTRQTPGAQKEIDDAFKSMESKFANRRSELIDEVAVLYAQLVPLDDMKAMTAFFLSPAGKRFTALQPQLMQQSMVVGQRWGEKIGREVEAEMREELKKRGVKQ